MKGTWGKLEDRDDRSGRSNSALKARDLQGVYKQRLVIIESLKQGSIFLYLS